MLARQQQFIAEEKAFAFKTFSAGTSLYTFL